jgi:hypothetical protein
MNNLREALDEALADNKALRAANTKLVLAKRERIEAALSAQPQPDAAAWRFRFSNRVEGRAWIYANRKPNENMGCEIQPLYLAPPLAPDVRMRRALETTTKALQELKDAVERSGKLNGREYVSLGIHVNGAIADARHALSRADEGTKSEGGPLNWRLSDDAKARIAEIDANRRNAALNASNIMAGSPTPPDHIPAEQREAIARIIDPRAFIDCGEIWAFNMKNRRVNALTKADAILALLTRAGG